jgi:hypothetical protein
MKKLSFLLLLGVGALMESANAGPILTLTEVSNTELDYSWSDGSGSGQLFAAPNFPDHWSGAISGPNLGINDSLTGNWREPELNSLNSVSVVSRSNGIWQLELFQSDVPTVLTDYIGANGDGDIAYPHVPSQSQWAIKVVDLSDAKSPGSVPKVGSTALLLGLGLSGSAVVRKRLANR